MKKPIVVVTGGSSNIGWACVQNFKATHHVVIGDLRAPVMESAEVSYIETDISNPDSCREMMSYAASLGLVEAVVHCAAVSTPAKPVEAISVEEWTRVININLNGAFFVAQAAIPHLRDSAGSLVMVASRAARTGYAALAASSSGTKPHYCASKAGVLTLVKSLAIELASQGIRVNAVVPGSIEGTMIPKERWPEMSRQIPLGKLGLPSDIADAVQFLTSKAAKYITGHALDVNGGTWMN